jgi:hypothetical protein
VIVDSAHSVAAKLCEQMIERHGVCAVNRSFEYVVQAELWVLTSADAYPHEPHELLELSDFVRHANNMLAITPLLPPVGNPLLNDPNWCDLLPLYAAHVCKHCMQLYFERREIA